MKPGRNDPCPCGSGKKYKQCCLGRDSASVVELADRTWRQMREAIDGYAATMLRFIGESYGRDALQQAWLEFTLGASHEFVQGDPNTELFFSWLFHRWRPDTQKGNEIADQALYGISPTRAYLDRRATRLNPLLYRYLEACLATPFAFHEILDCQPSVGFVARDVFTGALLNVRERSASSTLKNGDIIFGQVVPVQAIAMLEAVSPFSFPPIFKTHLIHVRQRGELREHADLALRGLYFTLADSYLNPPPPDIRNTDGERLEPRTLYFDVESAQGAFDALAPLAVGTARDELIEDAKFDVSGAVIEALIPWVKRTDPKRSSLETVLMGRIRIQDRKLTVEVNSAGRARTIRALIEESLGVRVRYRRTRKQPLEGLVPPMPAGPGVQVAPRGPEDSELMQLPEVRAQLEEFQGRHYESWPEIPIPALNGRTPLEAVKDADGREMVEALITQFERDARATKAPTSPEVFATLRRRLGLTSRS
jgi:SEC-C motif